MACFTAVSREALAAAAAAADALRALGNQQFEAARVAGSAARSAEYASILTREDSLLAPATIDAIDDVIKQLRAYSSNPAGAGVEQLAVSAGATFDSALVELDALVARMPTLGHHTHAAGEAGHDVSAVKAAADLHAHLHADGLVHGHTHAAQEMEQTIGSLGGW